MTRLVAITGASGFVGSHVAEAFVEAGWRCRLLMRLGSPPPPVTAETVAGGLGEPGALEHLLAGADAIVHAAGLTASKDPAGFERVNVAGTAAVIHAWQKVAPKARFTLISSMAAREPGISPYAASKRRAEEVLYERPGHWCILRPSAVYGPRDAATLALFRMANAPFQPVVGPEDARVCLVHAEDLAQAIRTVTEHAPARALWEISDARLVGYAWRDMAEQLAQTMGRSPRPVALPPWLVDALGTVAEAAPIARRIIGPLTADKIRELRHTDWSSCAAAQPPAVIWTPRLSLADGFERTVRVLESSRLLRRRRMPIRPQTRSSGATRKAS
ncbi:MAG: NAD-dependent epimerase/dehydratase family protein [Pseudomonadota bacterium]